MTTLIRRLGYLLCTLTVVVAGCTSESQAPTPPSSADPVKAQAVLKIVRDTMAQAHLKAALVRVTVDGKEIVTQALGDSMTGVPATTSMFFRNGTVAMSYVSTLLLKLVDEKKLRLDDKLSTWLPDVPNADRVTLRQLAHMTSGYQDYVNDEFTAARDADPFRQWTPEELLGYAVHKPLLYEPGTNWNYARTNYVLLGLALEKATGVELPKLLADKVLGPLALINTANTYTPQIPVPTLHAFTSERRRALKIPPGTPFYEDATFWNPSWMMPRGAVQTTNIYDLEATAVGIGSGKLLSPESYKAMVTPDHGYGLGIVISGNWLLQNPMSAGVSAVEAYLPSQKIAIAVAVTYAPTAFDDQGNYRNEAETLFAKVGAELAPNDAPPE
ncbi:possible conserved lipoprotein LpqK [Mycobacterium sp. MFM001]|uniref:serine hydrolase domain-containing protein n=1 Tax=Mycobacterium sp. MFM001 TaxID=2049453 RepID=UPI000DA57635|nr:serine hydrolase domain-containing protein [Mycobacterium sp. MFM001]GBE65803.1 possible conserved lipoprotein LpqK [Mycobacterium sp. MFM001]